MPHLRLMKIKLPVIYSQFDPQWKNALLGTNTDPKYNLYNFGCLVACLAMVARYYLKVEDPSTLNTKLVPLGGFVNGGSYVWGSLQRLYGDIQEQMVNSTTGTLTDNNMQEIRQALDSGHPVIAQLDYNPKTIAFDSHFVVLIGYNEKDENDFTVADPLGARTHSLKDYLAWYRPNARVSIKKYAIFRGEQVQSVPTPPVVAPVQEQQPISAPVAPQVVGALPDNYAAIIHKSSQWDDTVKYLELGKAPEHAFFEEVKKVIAGYKSAKTDFDNKRVTAEKKAAEYSVTIESQKIDIGRLNDKVTRLEKLHKAEVDALKQNTPTLDRFQGQVETVIADMDRKLIENADVIKSLKVELAHEIVDNKVKPTDNGKLTDSSISTPTHLLVTQGLQQIVKYLFSVK